MTNTTASVIQVLVGATLIITAMSVNAAPLGGLALLPLIGAIPVFFGLFGVQSPACKLITKAVSLAQSQAVRVLPKAKQVA